MYKGQQNRVIFGAGSVQQLGDEIWRLGASRALILSTPGQRHLAEKIMGLLGSRAAGMFDKAVMHVPVETARQAREFAQRVGADCAVAIGGGSTIGLGKAIALESALPIVAIPTTYSGSEVTSVYGLTENGMKKTGKDQRVLPKTVIYDPDLTQKLPMPISITSGINAIAHAAEGLYAQDGNPMMSQLAEDGIRALGRGLSGLATDCLSATARSDCLYGAWLCGTVLGNVGMALHHKLCHTLGGTFNLPHAVTHTIILPHSISYNEVAVPGLGDRISKALTNDSGTGGGALYDLASKLGAPLALRDLGLSEADLEQATNLALSNPYWNPRPIERNAIRALLQNAYEGARPR
jgi:maleylacetate reductase